MPKPDFKKGEPGAVSFEMDREDPKCTLNFSIGW